MKRIGQSLGAMRRVAAQEMSPAEIGAPGECGHDIPLEEGGVTGG